MEQIFLIGGGEIKNGETKSVDDLLINKFKRENSNFLFFPTAANDNLCYIDQMRKTFSPFFNFDFILSRESREDIVKKIKNASVIYLGGGKTEYLISLIEQKNLINEITNVGTLVGISAGAQAISRAYANVNDKKIEWRKGLGLANIACVVHARENVSKKTFQSFKEGFPKSAIIFAAIGEKSALIISPSGKYSFCGEGKSWISEDGKLVKNGAVRPSDF